MGGGLVADLQPERLEQPAKRLRRCGCEVQRPQGELVEEDRRLRVRHRRLPLQGLQLLKLRPALLLQLDEALPHPVEHQALRVVVELQAPDESLLPALQVSQGLLQRSALVPPLPLRLPGKGVQIGFQQPPPIGAEDALGEEPGNPVQEAVLVYQDRRGVSRQSPRSFVAQIWPGLAHIVGVPMPRLAEHPVATRGAEDERAEPVAPFRLRGLGRPPERTRSRSREVRTAASNISRVTTGSWVVFPDHTHSSGGFPLPPRFRARRFQTM